MTTETVAVTETGTETGTGTEIGTGTETPAIVPPAPLQAKLAAAKARDKQWLEEASARSQAISAAHDGADDRWVEVMARNPH